jgi:hypothetical protein
MTPLEIVFHVLELVATFCAGAWAGKSKCHVAFEVDSDETRQYAWLDRIFPCQPCKALPKGASWRKQASGDSRYKINDRDIREAADVYIDAATQRLRRAMVAVGRRLGISQEIYGL